MQKAARVMFDRYSAPRTKAPQIAEPPASLTTQPIRAPSAYSAATTCNSRRTPYDESQGERVHGPHP